MPVSLCQHEMLKKFVLTTLYIDGVEENAPCTAFETEYASGITIGSDDVTIECQNNNAGNNCAIRACIIEGNFVLSVFHRHKFNEGVAAEHGHTKIVLR